MPPPSEPDTVIFVNLVAIPSRRGGRGNGEAKQTIIYAKDLFTGRTGHRLGFDARKIRYIRTTSPDIDGIIGMHLGCGASDTGKVIGEFRDPFLNGLRGLTEEQFKNMYPIHDSRMNRARIMDYPV